MKAQFRLNGRVGEGEVVQRNSLTTLVKIRRAKLDVQAMRWITEIKVIKRHNRKHGVQFI